MSNVRNAVERAIVEARKLLDILEEPSHCPDCGAPLGHVERRYDAQAVRLRDAILDLDSAERAEAARA